MFEYINQDAIIKTGTVTISEDGILVEGFHFDGEMLTEEGLPLSDEALFWAKMQIEAYLRGE